MFLPSSSSPSAPTPFNVKFGSATYLDNKDYRFLIMDAPTDANLPNYIEVLTKRRVRVVVRACDPSYAVGPLTKAGITVQDLPFPDGDPPPEQVVTKWLKIVADEFKSGDRTCIAVHCVAGLGRAPVLVAIALVEGGMDPYDAINFIRKRRRGALNARQLKYIETYKRRIEGKDKTCVIS